MSIGLNAGGGPSSVTMPEMEPAVDGSTTAVGAGGSAGSPSSFLLQPMIPSAIQSNNTTGRILKCGRPFLIPGYFSKSLKPGARKGAALRRAGGENVRDNGERAVNRGAVHVEVGDHTDSGLAGRATKHTMLGKSSAHIGGIAARPSDVENQDVRHNLLWIDGNARNFRQPLSQIVCVFVIAMKNFWRLFQRNQAGSREHAGLAHPAAKQLSRDARLVDKVARADQHGADGSSQTLRQAEHDGIEFARDLGNAPAQRNCGIEDARAIQMN